MAIQSIIYNGRTVQINTDFNPPSTVISAISLALQYPPSSGVPSDYYNLAYTAINNWVQASNFDFSTKTFFNLVAEVNQGSSSSPANFYIRELRALL